MVDGNREYNVSMLDSQESIDLSNCEQDLLDRLDHSQETIVLYNCEQVLLERIFRGKVVYENIDPEDGGNTKCFLCQDKILATESRLFYSCLCDTTIKSKGGVHASCLLSGLLLHDTFPASLKYEKTVDVGRDMKCTNCKESLMGNLVCMLPYRVGKELHFDLRRSPITNYEDQAGGDGNK